MRPHIDRQIATGQPVVTAERPAMYARTSGTTGKPKLIPVTEGVIRSLRRAQRAVAYVQHRSFGAFRGRVLALAGAVREETLPDGTPAGATTGLIYQSTSPLIRAKYVLPAQVFEIEDYDLRYAVMAQDCRAIRRHQRDRHRQPVDDPAPAARDRNRPAAHRRRTRARRLEPCGKTAARADGDGRGISRRAGTSAGVCEP